MQFKIYRLETIEPIYIEKMTFYGITKLKPNLCYNLLYSYYNNNDGERPYFKIFASKHWSYEIVEEFDNRKDAKTRLKAIIDNDANSINKVKVIEPVVEPVEPIIETKEIKVKKPNKTDDPNYSKNYYLQNKARIKTYYNNRKEQIIIYQKNRYKNLKEKLKKLSVLEKILK